MKWKVMITAVLILVIVQSFVINRRPGAEDDIPLLPTLSGYGIFQGNASDLIPGKAYLPYDIATPLFSDYAEKQRLVRIPPGYSMKVINDGLPEFPNGTILVKTFFHFNDARDKAKGTRIIETRVLIKTKEGWNAGTYVWNAQQTDAVLTTSGLKENVQWVDGEGASRNIKYQVPATKQCFTCHNSGGSITPIGFKIRNLNIEVIRQNATINQLTYFHNNLIIDSINPGSFTSLPGWQNTSYTLEQRARAYLEINCAHCHNSKGFCAKADFHAGYELTFDETNINNEKKQILTMMKNGRMPLLGTTVVHREGLALIDAYIKSLK